MKASTETRQRLALRALGFVILWSIVGYPLLAGLSALLEFDNSAVSLTVRAIVAACAGLLAFSSPRGRTDITLQLFAFFWLVYLLRLVISLHLFDEFHSRPAEEYWIWAVGACLLPAFITFRAADTRTAAQLRIPLLFLSLAAILLALGKGSTVFTGVNGQTIDINRWNLGSLNPISTGHLGVTGILLGIGVLWTGSRDRLEVLLAFGAIFAGVILTVLANSRGPVVALAVSIVVMLLATRRISSALLLTVIGLGVFIGLVIFVSDGFSLFEGLTIRFSDIQSGADLSAVGRTNSFQGAIDQFLGSPIFGDGIEERSTAYYPHNLVLEAFMATGILGGIPFTLLLLASWVASWRLLRRGSPHAWVGLLAVQYIVGAEFSGSLYLSTAMWVTVPFAIVVARETEKAD